MASYSGTLEKGVYSLSKDIVLTNGETLYAGEYVLIHYIDLHSSSTDKVYLKIDIMSAVNYRYGTVKITFDTYEQMKSWLDRLHYDEKKTHLYENINENRKRKYYRRTMLVALLTMIIAVVLGLMAGNAFDRMAEAMTCSIVIGAFFVLIEYVWVYAVVKLSLEKFYYLEYDKMWEDFHKMDKMS